MDQESHLPKRVVWTKAELNSVAKEYARKWSYGLPTWGYILKAQEVLPPERRRKTMTGEILDEFRKRVEEIRKAIESGEDTTQGLSNGDHETAIVATPPPAPPAIQTEPILSHPVQPPTSSTKQKTTIATPEIIGEVVAILADINHKAIALNSLNLHELSHVTQHGLDVLRIKNLVIKATDSLTYFDTLLTAASCLVFTGWHLPDWIRAVAVRP